VLVRFGQEVQEVSRRVVVVHFNPPNLDKRLARLAGHDVEEVMPKGPADLKPLRERPPDALVVDLDRRPSEGRSVAVQLRRYASTRPVPLVFAGGEEGQVARVRKLLPDATYVSWQGVLGGLKRAKREEKPIVPGTMDAYSQTELEPKLGVRDGTTLLLLGAPDASGRLYVGRSWSRRARPSSSCSSALSRASHPSGSSTPRRRPHRAGRCGSAGPRKPRESSPTWARPRSDATPWIAAWSTSRSQDRPNLVGPALRPQEELAISKQNLSGV
jgi:hypothetical protein